MFNLQDGYCHFEEAEIGAKISNYMNVTSGDQTALKIAIATKGPVSVGIDASHKSFAFYSSGVYYEPKCGMHVIQLSTPTLRYRKPGVFLLGEDFFCVLVLVLY